VPPLDVAGLTFQATGGLGLVLAGGLSGAAGDATGQLVMTGRLDLARTATAGALGALTAGVFGAARTATPRAAAALREVSERIGPNLRAAAPAAKSRTLYRGDSRGPDEIFRSGFVTKGGDASYEDFVLRNKPSRWVSTSQSKGEARSFSAWDPKTGHRGWVYEIADPGGGIVARKVLRLPWLYRTKKEVSFEGPFHLSTSGLQGPPSSEVGADRE
jgi:hypothetical protein